MPLYEYECVACQDRFERIQKSYSDAPIETCPKCGKGPVRKLISSPAIQFKGSGWYITDYAKKSGTDAGPTGGGTSSTTDKSDKSGKSEKSEKSEKGDKGDKAESSSKTESPTPASSDTSTPKPKSNP
jgi:putative FmdB family regulatory protein